RREAPVFLPGGDSIAPAEAGLGRVEPPREPAILSHGRGPAGPGLVLRRPAFMPETLALFGGPKTIRAPFVRYNSIGKEEAEAAKAVLESGLLSGFSGAWGSSFYGGPKVQAFERAWAADFGVRHAVAVNSATSGLMAAVGAAGIEPGDEVIVS